MTVFGVGDRAARWMIIGEAPGAEEDRRGEPLSSGAPGNCSMPCCRRSVCGANRCSSRTYSSAGRRTIAIPRRRRASLLHALPASPDRAGRSARARYAWGALRRRIFCSDDAHRQVTRGQVHALGRRSVVVTYHPATEFAAQSDGETQKLAGSVVGNASVRVELEERMNAEAQPWLQAHPVRFGMSGATDVDGVVKVERASYVFPWSEGIFSDCMRVGYVCRVIEWGGEVAGYGIMSLGARREAHILNLCVRDDLRNHGIARALMHALLQHAADAMPGCVMFS